MGPELGLTQPGMTIVCGDSHTSTHGAFGALAFGIGTSEVEHVLATQTLLAVAAEDDARALRRASCRSASPRRIWCSARSGGSASPGGVGHAIEYAGAGDRGALDGGPDDDLQHVDRGRRARGDDRARRDDVRVPRGPAGAPRGAAWERALDAWRALPTDPGASFDRVVEIDVARARRRRSPGARTRAWSRRSTAASPIPAAYDDPAEREAVERALALHGARAGHADPGDRASTASSSARARTRGSRTCARRRRSSPAGTSRRRVRAMVVPGSAKVKLPGRGGGPRPRLHAARASSGARPGCSMCLGMNPDILAAGRALRARRRTATSRAGRARGGRTHLVSPGDGRGGRDRGPLHRRAGARMRELRQRRRVARAVLDRADVDTDQIIPKQFLKRIERSGLRRVPLLRLDEGSRLRAAPARVRGRADPRRRAQLRLRLLARARGLGARGLRLPRRSSRRASATSSARTRSRPGSRRSSCREDAARTSSRRRVAARNELTVDLEALEITHPDGLRIPFELDPYARETLIHGLDDIARTLTPRGADRGLRGGARRRGSTRPRSRGSRPTATTSPTTSSAGDSRSSASAGDLVQLAGDRAAVGMRAARHDRGRRIRRACRARSGAPRCRSDARGP